MSVVAFIRPGRPTLGRTRPTTTPGRVARSPRDRSPTPWVFDQAQVDMGAQKHGWKRRRRLRRPLSRKQRRRRRRSLGAHRPSKKGSQKVMHKVFIHVRRAQSRRQCQGVHHPTKCGHHGGPRHSSSSSSSTWHPNTERQQWSWGEWKQSGWSWDRTWWQ